MNPRHLDPPRLFRRSLQMALVLGVAACGASTIARQPQPPGVAEMQGSEAPATFRFWAPPGTSFVRTERRRFDAVLVGTDVADHDESELRWSVSMHPLSPDVTVVDQRLERVIYVHDGRNVVSGAPDALVELVFDSEGTLQSVSGLERVAGAVRALASPEDVPLVDRMFSSGALGSLVRVRATLMIGDLVGRPTGEGATWIVEQRPGDNALFTRYKVEGARPCDASPGGMPTTCQQVHVWVDVQPRAAELVARSLVDRHARERGQEAIAVLPEWRGGYHLWGSMRVQPATMLPAGAELREAGHLSTESRGRRYDVDMRALTDDTFDYGPQAVASARAAAEQ